MEYDFQKFTAVGKRFENRISVTRNRAIGFPTQFYKENGVRKFKYATLFFDRSRNAIGIKFTNNEEESGRLAISHSKNDYGGHILANSFFKANRINPKRFAGRYEYDKRSLSALNIDEPGDMFIIQLAERPEFVKPNEEGNT